MNSTVETQFKRMGGLEQRWEMTIENGSRLIILRVTDLSMSLVTRGDSPCAYPDFNTVCISNRYWNTFSKEFLRAIVWHEVGHIIHEHPCGERRLEREVEADLYAAKKMGKRCVINMLKENMRFLMGEVYKRKERYPSYYKRDWEFTQKKIVDEMWARIRAVSKARL